MQFLKSLFGRNRQQVEPVPVVIYKNLTIQPSPKKSTHGWTTEAVISLERDGETLKHYFIRADFSPDKESAIELSLSKAQTMIDQMGESIFSK